MAVAMDAVYAHHRQGGRSQEGGTKFWRDKVGVRARIDDEGVSRLARQGGVACGYGENALRQARVAASASRAIGRTPISGMNISPRPTVPL